MAAFCCIYGLNDGEEAIGSERVVGENELKKRSLNLTARGGPACGSTQSRWDYCEPLKRSKTMTFCYD